MSDDKALREAIRRSVAHAEPKKDLIDRIDELEAKLAKAVAFMNHVADGQSKDYTNNCDLARTTLAELKGQNDE